MEYNEKLKSLNFKNANNFLSDQTLDFGNKTVITSAFLILLCLNFLSINSFEVGGVNVSIKSGLLSFVLLLVNMYFYNQFLVARNVDEASFSLPEEIIEFKNQIDSIDTSSITELNNLNDQLEEIEKKLQNDNLDDIEKEYNENAKLILTNEILELSEILKPVHSKIIKEGQKITIFKDTVEKYNSLNSKIPSIAYHISLAAAILRFIIYTTIFIQQDKPFLEYFDKDLEIIQSIFQNTEEAKILPSNK